jgi:hypothetical protein
MRVPEVALLFGITVLVTFVVVGVPFFLLTALGITVPKILVTFVSALVASVWS